MINAAELVTHSFPLAQITEAFATAQKPESLKVIVTFAKPESELSNQSGYARAKVKRGRLL